MFSNLIILIVELRSILSAMKDSRSLSISWPLPSYQTVQSAIVRLFDREIVRLFNSAILGLFDDGAVAVRLIVRQCEYLTVRIFGSANMR